MPTYIYQCESCKLKFEERSSYSDPLREKCINPDCGGKVHVVIQSIPFSFKKEGKQREKQADGSTIWS